jgi:hypothetical protein
MALKLTQKKQEELLDKMTERLSQSVREMIEPRSLASRIYPNLKSKPDEPNETKKPPVDGWGKRK